MYDRGLRTALRRRLAKRATLCDVNVVLVSRDPNLAGQVSDVLLRTPIGNGFYFNAIHMHAH